MVERPAPPRVSGSPAGASHDLLIALLRDRGPHVFPTNLVACPRRDKIEMANAAAVVPTSNEQARRSRPGAGRPPIALTKSEQIARGRD
jgi:hypothetical protein